MHETVCTRPSFWRPGYEARERQWALANRRGLKLLLIITGSDWPRTTPQITTVTTNSTTKWDTDIAQMHKGMGDKMGVVSFLGSPRIICHAQSPLCKHSPLVHKFLLHFCALKNYIYGMVYIWYMYTVVFVYGMVYIWYMVVCIYGMVYI